MALGLNPIGVYADPADAQDTNDRMDQAVQTAQSYDNFAKQVNQHIIDQGAQLAQFQAMAAQHVADQSDAYQQFQDRVAGHLANSAASGADGSGGGTPAQPMPSAPSAPPTSGSGQTDVGGLVPAQYNDQQLTSAQANAACGPAAAVAFARANGRNPTLQEAVGLAQQVGWTPEGGMNGVANEKALLDKMGLNSRLETTPDWNAIQQDASGGNPVAISTPQHYFVVDGYDAQSGKYHVGNSGTAVGALGGSEWMAPDDLARVGRGINGVLYADHPLAQGPSTTELPAQAAPPTEAPGTFAEKDISSIVPNVYNEEAPGGLGTFRQVTQQGGETTSEPTAQPTDDQQATYDAQQAATQGFTQPVPGAPLLASNDFAPPDVDLQAKLANSMGAGGLAPNAQTDQGPAVAMTTPAELAAMGPIDTPSPSPALTAQPQQGSMEDVKATLADLLHKAANVISGVENSGAAKVAGKVLGAGEGPAPGLPPEIKPEDTGLTQGDVNLAAPEDVRPLISAYPQIEKAGQAAAGVLAPMAPAAAEIGAAKPVAEAASTIVDRLAPEIAGGSSGQAPKAIEDLNGLIGSFGKAIEKSATPAEATRQVAQADQAATALSKGLADQYAAFKLTPEENQGVADIIEGVSRVDQPPLSGKASQVAEALQQTNDAAWQMAHDAGVMDGMTENYFTHLVRVPADELRAMGGSVTPSALSDWTRFAASRARDEAGNVLNPTVRDLKDYLAQAHPTWQVVEDVPTIVAAHVRSLVTAADHAQLGEFLKGAVDEAGQPLLSATKRPGDVLLNLPQSLSKWLYRGTAPEAGAIAIPQRGAALGGDEAGQAVLTQMPLHWAQPDVAKVIDRYVAPDLLAGPIERGQIPQAVLKIGSIYDKINRGIVTLKLMNPIVHTWNMLSETAKQFARPTQALGVFGDFAKANEVLRDPVAMTKLLQEAPLRLSSVRQFAGKLAQATGRIPEAADIPVISGGQNVASKLAEADHNLLFNTIGQRLQLASYFGARRDGMDAVTAAKYANAKFGQFSPQDFNALTRWVNQHVAFAGNWTAGSLVQYGSLLKSAGYGGYAEGLTAAQTKALTGALRGDLLRGVALGAATSALVNKGVSGHWPWENKQGRMLDIELPNGEAIPNPFFKREQDLVKILTGVGGGLNQGDVAGAIQAPEGVAANKVTPVMSAIGGAKDASTAIRKGGDFGTSLERSLQYLGSAALPGVQPPQYKAGPDIGPIGTALGLRELNAPGRTSTSGRPVIPRAPAHH